MARREKAPDLLLAEFSDPAGLRDIQGRLASHVPDLRVSVMFDEDLLLVQNNRRAGERLGAAHGKEWMGS